MTHEQMEYGSIVFCAVLVAIVVSLIAFFLYSSSVRSDEQYTIRTKACLESNGIVVTQSSYKDTCVYSNVKGK